MLASVRMLTHGGSVGHFPSTRNADQGWGKSLLNAPLAAHGAAPQRQINHTLLPWRGAMPC